MLITDIYTLQTVYTLYFTEHVILNGAGGRSYDRVAYRTLCQLIAGL